MQMKIQTSMSKLAAQAAAGLSGPGSPRVATGSAFWAIHRELSVESGALQLQLQTAVTIADSGSGTEAPGLMLTGGCRPDSESAEFKSGSPRGGTVGPQLLVRQYPAGAARWVGPQYRLERSRGAPGQRP